MISRPEIQAFLGTYQEGAEKLPVHLQLHPGVDPSSIFLTGSSGSGKSTAGQCKAIQFAKQKPPCSPWTLDTLCRLITFAHRCPLNLRHWQSGMISTMNLCPPTFSILNLVEAIQSPPMTQPMVFARSLDKIIVLALLKSHHSQPRLKRLWSAGKFVPISSQAFLRH